MDDPQVSATVRYRLVFDRIGRRPAAPVVVEMPAELDDDARAGVITAAVLELAAERHTSAELSVFVDLAAGRGGISTPHRAAGTFAISDVTLALDDVAPASLTEGTQ